MSEFVFNDGRKAERVENNPDPMTKVTEVYVEPKQEKKLAQRVTERLCVCERELETIDESTGEVISRIVEKVCEGNVAEKKASSRVSETIKKRIIEKKKGSYLFVAAAVVLVVVLAYVMFGM